MSIPQAMPGPKSANKGKLVVVVGIAVALLAFGYHELMLLRKDANGLRNVLSADYWRSRSQGLDVYSAHNAFLKRGPHGLKAVCFTFDDGPHPDSLPELLAVLKRYKVKATFFVVGLRVKQHPELVRQILADGHEVGNHTQDHLRLDTLTLPQVQKEVENCDANVYKATGAHTYLFRPPGMRFGKNDDILQTIKAKGYITIGYTVGAKDFGGKEGSADIVAERVLKQVDTGSIILLHDDKFTAAAMPKILDKLIDDGYEFDMASEFLAKLPHPIAVKTNAGFVSKLSSPNVAQAQ